MRKKRQSIRQDVFRVFLLFLTCIGIQTNSPLLGQGLRTSYFMDVPNRLEMNPALLPSVGYFNATSTGEYTSNSLTIDKLLDVTDITDKGNTIPDKDGFVNQLLDNNKIQSNAAFDLLSFGFYTGKSFWSFHAGIRIKGQGSIPKEVFELANDLNDLENLRDYTIPELQLGYQGYGEAGIGYGRQLTDRLTIGGRINVLIGLAQSSMKMKNLQIRRNGDYATVIPQDTELTLSPGNKFDTVEEENDFYENDGTMYLDKMYPDHFAVSGFGMGFDVGASFRILNELTVSAAINNLGFFNWNNSMVSEAQSREVNIYDLSNDLIDGDILAFENARKENVRRSLNPVLNLGAEYGFLNNKLSVGILSSTCFGGIFASSELTLSGNYRPSSWFGATLSYSVIQSKFKDVGIGLKLGPLFIGSDYLFFKSPLHANTISGHIGVIYSLGKKHKSNKRI